MYIIFFPLPPSHTEYRNSHVIYICDGCRVDDESSANEPETSITAKVEQKLIFPLQT